MLARLTLCCLLASAAMAQFCVSPGQCSLVKPLCENTEFGKNSCLACSTVAPIIGGGGSCQCDASSMYCSQVQATIGTCVPYTMLNKACTADSQCRTTTTNLVHTTVAVTNELLFCIQSKCKPCVPSIWTQFNVGGSTGVYTCPGYSATLSAQYGRYFTSTPMPGFAFSCTAQGDIVIVNASIDFNYQYPGGDRSNWTPSSSGSGSNTQAAAVTGASAATTTGAAPSSSSGNVNQTSGNNNSSGQAVKSPWWVLLPSTRGFVADVIFLDEGSFISRDFILTCPLPVGLNAHVVTFIATTPGKETSWFMQSIKLLDKDGHPLLPILRTYEPCDMHKKTPTPWTCTCKPDMRAPWKLETREDHWSAFWGVDQDLMAQEKLGVPIVFMDNVFNPTWVDRFRQREEVQLDTPVKYIYVGVDPSSGGPDNFGMCAMCQDNGTWVVIYLAAFKLTFGDERIKNEQLDTMLQFFAQTPVYRHAHIVFMIENVGGNRAGEFLVLMDELQRQGRITVMCEMGRHDPRPGINKTAQTTEVMVNECKNILCTGNVARAKNMGTHTSSKPEAMFNMLLEQTQSIRFDEQARKYTGKGGASANTRSDDLWVSFAMIPVNAHRFNSDIRYSAVRGRVEQAYRTLITRR